MNKLSHHKSVKLSSTLGGQREQIREITNKVNELVDYIVLVNKKVNFIQGGRNYSNAIWEKQIIDLDKRIKKQDHRLKLQDINILQNLELSAKLTQTIKKLEKQNKKILSLLVKKIEKNVKGIGYIGL